MKPSVAIQNGEYKKPGKMRNTGAREVKALNEYPQLQIANPSNVSPQNSVVPRKYYSGMKITLLIRLRTI